VAAQIGIVAEQGSTVRRFQRHKHPVRKQAGTLIDVIEPGAVMIVSPLIEQNRLRRNGRDQRNSKD
jgi:hypothetical protein